MQKRSLENQLSYQSFKADAHKKASAFLVPKIFKNIIKIGSRFFIRIVKKVLDMNFLFIYEQILIFCEKNLLIYEEILEPRKIGRFGILIIRR